MIFHILFKTKEYMSAILETQCAQICILFETVRADAERTSKYILHKHVRSLTNDRGVETFFATEALRF